MRKFTNKFEIYNNKLINCITKQKKIRNKISFLILNI